jgi:hypothetical protein
MKKIILSIGAFIVSILLVVAIFQLVNPSKKEDVNKVTVQHNTNAELNETKRILECQKEYPNISTIEHKKCVENIVDTKNINNSFWNSIAMYRYMTDKEKAPDFVIKLIYILIWIALWMQTSLLFFSLFCKNLGIIKDYYFHIVDTALNSPPILGVMGTIYSFAIYTTELDNTSDLIEGFKSSFFDAAFTTIIAGFIYVINLYFKIIILKEKEE